LRRTKIAEIKVTQLPEASYVSPSDLMMVIQNGVNKKIPLSTFLKSLNSNDSIKLNSGQNAIEVILSSKNIQNLLVINGASDRIGVGTSSPQSIFHVNEGNTQVGGSAKDGVYIGSSELIQHPSGAPSVNATISPLRETSALEIYGASTYSLGNGAEGQTKYIYLKSIDTGGSSATITVANGLGFNRIGLSIAVGDGCTLKYLNSKWICVGNNGVSLTTV